MVSKSESETEHNRKIIRDAFGAWARGGDRFFDILAKDATWIISASGPAARTYHDRQTYIDEVIKPLQARFSEPIVPLVHDIWSDGDEVIVRWEQDTLTREGKRYRNSYAWFFKMMNGKAVEVTAFLDHAAYEALFAETEQVPLKPQR